MSDQSSEHAEAASVVEAEEEQRLDEQCRSSFYNKHSKLIKMLMMLSSVTLVAEPTDSSPQLVGGGGDRRKSDPALCNVLRPVSMLPECRPKIDSKPGASWFRRLVWPPFMGLLIVLYLHYAFVKMVPLSILSLKRHFVLRTLKPNVQPQALRTEAPVCGGSSDLYFNTLTDWAEFDKLKSLEAWLKFLGATMVSVPEFAVSCMFLLAIVPLAYHHMRQLFLSLNQYRNDTLCFMLDPLGERRKIGAELRSIVHEMVVSQSNHKDNLYYGCESSTALYDNDLPGFGLRSVWQRKRLTASGNGSCSRTAELEAGADSHEAAGIIGGGGRRSLMMSDNQTRRLRFRQSLVKIKYLKQVDPYIVTSEWHRTLLLRTDLLLKMDICSAVAICTTMLLGSILYDLGEATRLRLEMIGCAQLQPQSGGIRIATLDHLYLDELKSAEQLDAYKAHDGSTLSFIKLALLVESFNYFSLKRAISWIESLLSGLLFVTEVFLSTTLQMTSTVEKIVWLHQLDKQMDRAADEAAEHAHRARDTTERRTQDEDEQLLNTLTLVYLNYELFRRQQNEYLRQNDPILICLNLLSVMSCLIIYSTGLSLGNSSPILVFSFCSPLLLQINLILVASSYRLKQMEKIMAKVLRILAHCSSPGHIQMSYPVELWRRQLGAFVESRRRYALRLFGVHVTYETVITLNIYAIALLPILLKPQRSPLLH